MKKPNLAQREYAKSIKRPDAWAYEVHYICRNRGTGVMGGGASTELEATAEFDKAKQYYENLGYRISDVSKPPTLTCGTCYGRGFLRKPVNKFVHGPAFKCPYCPTTPAEE